MAWSGESDYVWRMKIKSRWFSAVIERDGAWFRVCGYGLSVKSADRPDQLFSDRNRLGACVVVGPVLVRVLTP